MPEKATWNSLCIVEHVGYFHRWEFPSPTIAGESRAHVWRVVSHLFSHCIWRSMDIVITKDAFRTLVDIVIVNSTCIDLV